MTHKLDFSSHFNWPVMKLKFYMSQTSTLFLKIRCPKTYQYSWIYIYSLICLWFFCGIWKAFECNISLWQKVSFLKYSSAWIGLLGKLVDVRTSTSFKILFKFVWNLKSFHFFISVQRPIFKILKSWLGNFWKTMSCRWINGNISARTNKKNCFGKNVHIKQMTNEYLNWKILTKT